jgi:hypothetical protein
MIGGFAGFLSGGPALEEPVSLVGFAQIPSRSWAGDHTRVRISGCLSEEASLPPSIMLKRI